MTLGADGQGATVNSFFSNGAFTLLNGVTFSGSKANAASTLQVNNIFTINGGTISNFTIQQGVQQNGGPVPRVVFTNSGNNSIRNSIINANLDLATNANAYALVVSANTVNGSVNLGTTSGGLQLLDGNASLTLGGAGSLTGFGSVSQANGGATLTNGGTINANASGKTLSLAQSNTNSSGLVEATNGGILSLSTLFTGSGTAASGNVIKTSGGGRVQADGATLTGTVNTDAASAVAFTNNGGNSIRNSTVNGNLDLATFGNAYALVVSANAVNGNVNLGTTSGGLQLLDGNASLTLGASGSLTGFGAVSQANGGATLTNGGTINANAGGKTLAFSQSSFVNSGLVEATGGGVLSLSTVFTGSGTAASGNLFAASGGGRVQVDGGTLTGTVNTAADTAIAFTGSGNNRISSSVINGNLALTDSGAYALVIGANTVNGSVNLGTTSGGLQLLDGNASLTLGGAGSLTGFGSVSQANGGATLTNGGTINANASGKTLSLAQSNTNSSGLVEATNGGILSLSTLFTGTGTAASGNVIKTSGGGRVQADGATLTGTVNTDAASAVAFTGSGANALRGATVNGNLDLATFGNASAVVVGSNTVNGNIQMGTTSGGLQLFDGNTNLILGASGSLTGFGAVSQANGGAALTNGGTVNANVGGKTLSFTQSYFNNGGLVEATGGGVLSLSTNFMGSAGSSINGVGGTIKVAGANLLGTLNGVGTTSLVFDNNGGNALRGATANINLDLATNADASAVVVGSNTVNGNIQMGTTSGGLQLFDGNTNLILGASGSLTGFGAVSQANGGATLTNGGTINANASGKALTFSQSSFNSTGLVEATGGGVLSLSTNFTGSGTAASGNVIRTSGGGRVQVDGGTLIGTVNTDAASAVAFTGSGANALRGATVNGNLDLATFGNASAVVVGSNTVNGNIQMGTTSGGLQLFDGNTNLILGASGSLTGFGAVSQANGGAALTNGGTVNANASGKALTFSQSSFVNNGKTQVTSGASLIVSSNSTTSGTITVQQGGTAAFTNGLSETAGLTQVDGTVNMNGTTLTVSGGTLKGTGTINGNVTVTGGTSGTGGTLAPGDSPGTLTVSSYTQSGGTFALEYTASPTGPTAHDLLQVTGAANLTGGRLDVAFVGPPLANGMYLATPGEPGTSFDFLSFGTLTNTNLGSLFSNEYTQNGLFFVNGAVGSATPLGPAVYQLTRNGNALHLTLTTAAAPEPSQWASLGIGLVGLSTLIFKARRRSSRFGGVPTKD